MDRDDDPMVENFGRKPKEVFRQMIPVEAEAFMWLAVMANCNLALRHPTNTGPSAQMIQEFADALAVKLRDVGVLTEEEFQRQWNEQQPWRKP